jgi:hypothetical protein
MAAATNIRVLRRVESKGEMFTRQTLYQFTLDTPNIAANATVVDTAAIEGLLVGKDIVLGWTHNAEPSHDVLQEIHVGAANELHILSHNTSGAGVDPASAVYRVLIGRLNI